MRPSLKPLRLFVQFAAALGFLSISLTGEIAPLWIVAGWMSWFLSFIAHRYPSFTPNIKRFEIPIVTAMMAMLALDFFALHVSLFIAITHFLLLFQIVKLIGEKARKDYLQIFIFSFFQILAACTLSIDAWHAIVLLCFIPTATAVLYWNQIERESELAGGEIHPDTHRSYRRMATGICFVALPLNLLLTLGVFVLFPRLTLNASLPGFSGRRTGYTDQMNLAQKGSLQQDSSVVLWLGFASAEEHNAWSGYLRGDILNHFDGRQWTSSKATGSHLRIPDSNGIFSLRPHHPGASLIHQTITLADTSAATLFTISKPIRISAPLPAIQETNEGSLHWLVSWRRPLRYEAASESSSESEVTSRDSELPEIPLDRIRQLAHKIAGSGSPLEQAQKVRDYLQTTYRYSTNFGDQVPRNPVEYFLFDRREGTCGHFASAMALMLRLQHIPSRVVAGYFKGEWNEPAQSVVIRQRDAHAWVESYIAGQGWVSFDPTPRPVSGTALGQSVFSMFEQYWIYLDLQWNRFVIQYDLYSQIKAFENLKGTSGRLSTFFFRYWHRSQKSLPQAPMDSSSLFSWRAMVVFLFISLVSSLAFIHKRRGMPDAAIRFYMEFLDRMARAGHPKAPEETGEEFLLRIERERSVESAWVREVTSRYYHVRFGRASL